MAAVLACGPGARLAGAAAAYLLGIRKFPPSRPVVSTLTERKIDGIDTRRRRRDDPDTTRCRGIPTTSPARTLVELAATLDERELARVCHEAAVKHGTTPAQIEAVLARRRSAPGATSLRRILRGDAPTTLSRLEDLFQDRLEQRGLPRPQTNRPAGRHYVDCRWPGHAVTVELDSYAFHNTRHSWEQDREREREARARGDEFRRYTWQDVAHDPEPMLEDVEALLAG
jgi:very-short-patch-repair endonuclease